LKNSDFLKLFIKKEGRLIKSVVYYIQEYKDFIFCMVKKIKKLNEEVFYEKVNFSTVISHGYGR
jgi:hypothetical protein